MSDNFCDIAKRLAEKEAERWAWARPTAPPDIDMADIPQCAVQGAELYRQQETVRRRQVALNPLAGSVG